MSDILIYQTEDGRTRVNLLVQEHTVWLNQSQLAELFDTSVPNIATHIKNILEDKELDENSVIKEFLITAADGKQYQVKHYALEMILAIGFRVRSKRGVQFRRWANEVLTGYLEKGFVLDDKRLKNPNGRVDYFDELLERIRDIRASEMRFYQKVRELFKLSADYDPTDKATQMFFAQAQNKLIYAVTQQTADEIDTLNRLTIIFLESAELRAKNRQGLTLSFWQNRIDSIIADNGFAVLEGKGTRSRKQMEAFVSEQYGLFRQNRLAHMAQQAEAEDIAELEALKR